jgi:protein TonB
MATILQEPPTEQNRRTSAGPNLGEPDALRSTSPFASLVQNVKDVFFPEKLPPLQLESKPIAVENPMDVKRDPKSTAVAVVVHALIFLLIWYIGKKVITVVVAKKPELTQVTFDTPAPQPPLKVPAKQAMGGGGGAHDIAPVTKGRLPKFEQNPIVPPSNPPKIEPKLTVEPAINVQQNVKMANNNMLNLGAPNAPNVGVASLGNGSGGGLGSGNGNGLGAGSGGGTGGGVYRIGGDVSAPQLIYQVDPEFSEEARKAKFQGEVLVHLIVDAQGRPTNVKVIRPVGMGLDEKARDAVMQYKFRPARKGGQPVPVELNVAVNFQIF